jgi:cytochrome c oxidase assembly factor CtaG
MEALRFARLIGIRVLAALLVVVGVAVTLSVRALKKLSRPAECLDQLRSRDVLWPWLTHSSKLVVGTLAYNAFVFLFVEPILRRWFPPLKPWEHVQGLFTGSTRTTYEQIVPVVATVLWIAGNAFVIVLLSDRFRMRRLMSMPAENHIDSSPPSAIAAGGHTPPS